MRSSRSLGTSLKPVFRLTFHSPWTTLQAHTVSPTMHITPAASYCVVECSAERGLAIGVDHQLWVSGGRCPLEKESEYHDLVEAGRTGQS